MRYILILMMAGVMLLTACAPAANAAPVAATTIAVAEVLPTTAPTPETQPVTSYKDATYQIDNQSVTLINGSAESEAAPGSASKITTLYFGNEAFGDLNGDGQEDVAFLLTQNQGGSGTFFYVVVALRTDKGYQGTNAVFLGDRIAPQPTTIENGMVIVNYADRKPAESFDVQPSVGVSKYLKVMDGNLAGDRSVDQNQPFVKAGWHHYPANSKPPGGINPPGGFVVGYN